MYNQFSADYDRFVNWPARLAAEMPFIEQQLLGLSGYKPGSLRILDAACGTGKHAIALALKGYQVAGADFSTGMIERARANSVDEGVQAQFEVAGFGSLAEVFGKASFDALLCLGNSLPHILAPDALASTLGDFASCLKPGGLLMVQNRNFDRVLINRERWMEPQAAKENGHEWLFLRFYDFDPDGLISFHIITLTREEMGPWAQQIATTRLRPIRQAELIEALKLAGFNDPVSYGDMAGSVFQPVHTGNLVITARS